MINTLSILIPTYNNVCVELVKSLQAQASLLYSSSDSLSSSSDSLSSSSHFEYEILVADDGSTDERTIEGNRIINTLPHCRYIERKENVGRAAIRNFLAREAKYTWLLLVDSDLHIDHPNFLLNYLKTEGDIIVGGLKIGGDAEALNHNLRYRYEKACEAAHDYQHRKEKGDREFRSTNFLIARNILLSCPFDENFRYYGYEDVLLGKQLTAQGHSITHIDNAILLDEYEGNYRFVQKTEEACRTLYFFREELKGYSKLICYAEKMKRWHLTGICRALFPWLSLPIKARLTGNNPSVFWFNIYKLLYYMHL